MAISKTLSAYFRGANVWRSLVFPSLVAALSLTIAVVGAILIGQDSGIDGVNGFVEVLSGRSGSFLGGLAGASFLFALLILFGKL